MSPGTKKALKERFVEFELQYEKSGRYVSDSTASVDTSLHNDLDTSTTINYINLPNIYAYFSRPERRALERLGCEVKKYLR